MITSSVVTTQQQHNQKRIHKFVNRVPSNLSATYRQICL